MLKDIETSLKDGRSGKMPAHQDLFSEQETKVLSAYVLSF
jgi:cytochrome c oxidase cbb3-type subunit 3